MKNKILVIVVVLFLVVILLGIPWQAKPVLAQMYNHLYENEYKFNVTYMAEVNPDLIGSYLVRRADGDIQWTEFANWENFGELVIDSKKCVRFLYFEYGTFSASDGYEWILKKSPYGDPCLQLTKILIK